MSAQPEERKATMEINKRETATLLHALRVFQETMTPYNEPCTVGTCDHFADTTPLTAEEIDDLCERLNLGVEEDTPATSPDTTPTCKHCGQPVERDDDRDWIHATGFYGCATIRSDDAETWHCADVDEPA